jgi:hypothetical protein
MAKLEFIRKVNHAAINAATRLEIDLQSLKKDFGNDFNFLNLINTNASLNFKVFLDGQEMGYLTANNGSLSFDWQFGLTYNFLALENTDALVNSSANDIKIFIGRTNKED